MQIILSSWNSIIDVCLKIAIHKSELQVYQFVNEPFENAMNDTFMLNAIFSEHIEYDNDVFTTEQETMPDISNYLAQ